MSGSAAPQRDIFHPVLAIALLGSLLVASLWILRPFVPAIIWATMIVVATWPIMLAVQRRLRGKRWLAVTVMSVALLLVFVIPLSLAIGTIVAHVDDITAGAKALEAYATGAPPRWLVELPWIGPQAADAWGRLTADGNLGGKLTPYAGALAKWFVAQVGGFGAVTVQFLLTIAIAALLYMKGELAAGGVVRFARRITPEQGEATVKLAGQAIRGVALGVIVTAFTQSVLGGIGLAIAGVPLAAVLTAAMFMLAVAQIGAAPVLVCATIWVFVQGDTGWGIALAIWTVLVGSMDNVMRPMLIRKGADLPLLLIFAGVVGGLIAFGLVGLFIGPVVLAVTWTLFVAWVKAAPEIAPALDASATGAPSSAPAPAAPPAADI